MCLFQFHREILENLRANHTTPLFLATVLSFKSEIAQLLYPRLDLLLWDKKHYERRTKELFEDLGLEGETYRHRSARKRVIERALKEFQGVPLTTGCIVSATIEPTKDDCDFKIVICKGPRRKQLPKPVGDRKTKPSSSLAATSSSASSSNPLGEHEQSPEAALVRYFHQQFHGALPKGTLNPKELVQAARLVQQHGIAKAHALVDYARGEAPKTNYIPASLNGILHYEARFEAHNAAKERDTLEQRTRQEQQRRAQEALEARQHSVVNDLIAKAQEVKEGAPQAFTAFLRYIESRRIEFLETPIARKAKPQTREMLSREYDKVGQRLELFIDFFRTGSEGETFLSINAQVKDTSCWLQVHGEEAREIIRRCDFTTVKPPI